MLQRGTYSDNIFFDLGSISCTFDVLAQNARNPGEPTLTSKLQLGLGRGLHKQLVASFVLLKQRVHTVADKKQIIFSASWAPSAARSMYSRKTTGHDGEPGEPGEPSRLQ